MNDIAALLLVGLGLPAAAQPFNLRVDPHGQDYAETAFGVELMDDGNYVVISGAGFTDGQLFYSSVVTAVVVSPTGEWLGTDHLWYPPHATYPGLSNSMDKRIDGGFVAGGNTFRTDSIGNWISRTAFFMLAPDGSIDSLLEVGPENQSWIGRQANQTPDGGYVICGETIVGGTQADAFVIKTDAQGNEEWTQTYGGQWNDYAVAIDRRPGTDYFMGGQKRITASNKQLWVQRLNEAGGVVWSKAWGSAFSEPNAHLTLASDGHALVASGWGYASNDQSRKYLAKLDPNDGAIVWEQQYGDICACPLFAVKEVTPGGDLIAAGQNANGANVFGTLLRTTSTGDSLWMRHYQYSDSVMSNIRGNLYDAVPTPDGGFVAVGMVYPSAGFSQDIWVVKVDSMGCLEPGCHLVTGMETQITNLRGALSVAPNPVSAGGSVQVGLNLPENFTPQGALNLTVVSSDGRVVQEETLPQALSSFSFQLSAFPAGLYHVHLHDDSHWIAGAKLVVE